MELEEVYRALGATLHKMHDDDARTEKQLAALGGVLGQLVDVLVARGVLSDGHRKVLDKAAELGRRSVKPKVKLRVVGDKYQFPGIDIDCASLFSLCHGRCCSLSFELSRQDVEEGKVLWEIDDPYVIRHEPDGYCSHIDRSTLFCTIHAQRPATCRGYDCRGDRRIWIDFEARIPAPMPPGLAPLPHEPEPEK